MYDEIQSYLYSGFQHRYFNVDESNTSGYLTVKCLLENFPFSRGRLALKGRITAEGEESDWPKCNLGTIDIQDGDFFGTGKITDIDPPFLIKGQWL